MHNVPNLARSFCQCRICQIIYKNPFSSVVDNSKEETVTAQVDSHEFLALVKRIRIRKKLLLVSQYWLCTALHCTALHCITLHYGTSSGSWPLATPLTPSQSCWDPGLTTSLRREVSWGTSRAFRWLLTRKKHCIQKVYIAVKHLDPCFRTTFVKSKYLEVLLGKSGAYKYKCTLKLMLSKNMVHVTLKVKPVPID